MRFVKGFCKTCHQDSTIRIPDGFDLAAAKTHFLNQPYSQFTCMNGAHKELGHPKHHWIIDWSEEYNE
jgi:hypothetical protein